MSCAWSLQPITGIRHDDVIGARESCPITAIRGCDVIIVLRSSPIAVIRVIIEHMRIHDTGRRQFPFSILHVDSMSIFSDRLFDSTVF